ncbi:MAG: hypothetical protein PHN56_04000 [Candidatus Nanoarchaeia archaeon]|nr:hypothetical protein [Candidatus Nanoarchaeia archaeon]
MKTYTFSYQDKNNNILKELKIEALNRKDAFRIREIALAKTMLNDLKKIRVYLDK